MKTGIKVLVLLMLVSSVTFKETSGSIYHNGMQFFLVAQSPQKLKPHFMQNLLKEPKFETAREVLHPLQILFFALISIPLIIFIAGYMLYKSGGFPPPLGEPGKAFFIMMTVISFGSLVGAQLLYVKRKKSFKAPVSLRIRMVLLYRARVEKYLLQAIGVMLSVLAFFVTGDPSMQALYLAMLIIMGLSNPTIFNMMNDLKLGKEEAQICRYNKPIE